VTANVQGCRWVVSGRVQGVGFRWYTVRVATQCGVVGWVRNLPDGRVEAVAKGTTEAIDAFDAALRRGPRMSAVENVDKVDIPHEMVTASSFTIK